MMQCEFDPKTYANQPIGMFHCPLCGEMVLAGMDHPDVDKVDEEYAKYCDEKYENMLQYFKAHIGELDYPSFLLLIDLIPNMKGTLLEIWLHAHRNLRDDNCTL